MKKALFVAVSLLCLWSVLDAAEMAEVTPLSSSITEVTVYSDRARVTRVSTLALEKGAKVYAFQELPGWIDEGSVRMVLSPAGTIIIHSDGRYWPA